MYIRVTILFPSILYVFKHHITSQFCMSLNITSYHTTTQQEKQLMKKLREVNDSLKKYASVNRKALDQYVSFNEQREVLIERQEEMDRDRVSIKQLIATLDQQVELTLFLSLFHSFIHSFILSFFFSLSHSLST